MSDIVVRLKGKCATGGSSESATNINLTLRRTGQPQFNALVMQLALQRVE
ncbi:hypothetical protein NKH98_28470 [Mesorhizobium sp. M0833]